MNPRTREALLSCIQHAQQELDRARDAAIAGNAHAAAERAQSAGRFCNDVTQMVDALRVDDNG